MGRRARVAFAFACAVSAASAACALVTDLGDLSSDAGDAGDAGDASACDAAGACTAAHVPDGWTPIAFHEGFVGCPAGFTSQKYVTDPTATCSCGCTVTQPDCTTGTIPTMFGTNNACSQPGVAVAVDGGCKAVSGTYGAYFEGTPIAPAGAACTVQATADASATNAEACVPQECGDAICRGVVPSGYKACIIAFGDLPCPSTTPFTVPTPVGASASATCGAGCACAVTGVSCQSPTLVFYSDPACATAVATLAVDSTCVATGATGSATLASLKYSATPAASCASSGTSKADASLSDRHTVCCAP